MVKEKLFAHMVETSFIDWLIEFCLQLSAQLCTLGHEGETLESSLQADFL